jgi:undecaprenyl-diphosphatase
MTGRRRAAAVAAGCVAAFGLLTLLLLGGPLPHLDLWARHWAVTHQEADARRVANAVLHLGEVRVAVPVLVAACGWVSWRVRSVRPLLLSLLLAGAVAALVLGLKPAIGRSPASFAADPDLRAGGRGYPSGHVATAAVCWGLAAAAVGAAYAEVRRWAVGVAVVATVLTAWAMVYGPAHWLTDTIAAMLLGGAAVATYVAVGGTGLIRRLRRRAQ